MNDASNFPESEQPEAETTSAQAGTETTSAQTEGTENTSAQAETAANGTGSAQGRVCPQCGAALEPGASFCTSCGAKIDGSEDVTYHIVRPEAERSYEDANFHPSDDAGNTPPRYYTPNDDAWAEKPKHKHRPRKPRTARTPEQKRLITRIACPVPRVRAARRPWRRRDRGAHHPLRQDRQQLRLQLRRHARDAARSAPTRAPPRPSTARHASRSSPSRRK